MKELHSFGWYAARVAPHMPEKAFKPVPSRLLGGLVHLLVVIGSFVAMGLFDLNIWILLGLSVILGSSFASLGFLGHEILHGTVVKTAWLRNFLGAIAFWPLCTGPRLWRKWHNGEHHAHTQIEEKDPDSWASMTQYAETTMLKWLYKIPLKIRAIGGFIALGFTFTIHSTRMFTVYVKEFSTKNRPVVWLQLLLPWAFWTGMAFILGPINWIFAFVIPLIISNAIVMAYISTNHRLNPLVDVNDPLANSLTVTVPKWVDFLHFNFSYHAEHHLFPGMNPKYYPLVKAHVKRMWPDRYFEMPMGRALKALYQTPRLYHEQTELIDPEQGKLYGSLGNGLDPKNISARQEVLSQDQLAKKKMFPPTGTETERVKGP